MRISIWIGPWVCVKYAIWRCTFTQCRHLNNRYIHCHIYKYIYKSIFKYVTTYFYSRLNQLSFLICSNFCDMFILLINKIIPPLFFMWFMMCISSKLAIIFYYYVILYSFLRKNKRLHLDDNKKRFSLIFRITMLWLQISIIVCEAFTHKEANE